MTYNNEGFADPPECGHDISRKEDTLPIRHGNLRPLKTVQELRAGDPVIDVYVTRIVAKAASRVLDALRSASPENGFHFHHLRRFAKTKDIPSHLDLKAPDEEASEASARTSLFLLLGTNKEFGVQALQDILDNALGQDPEEIHVITVPELAPTSQEQASLWSKKYWPTVYKKSNPFGPHPSEVSRAEQQLVRDVDEYMALAARAAREAQAEEIGEALGVVIVARDYDLSHPVSLAGDARWKDIEPRIGPGNVMAHAVMRAIAMVAQKLKVSKENASNGSSLPAEILDNDIFMDQPLTASEKAIYNMHPAAADGYLCNNLELYLTHEPCVMCCMAILQSRFGRVVFGQRMPKTGGLCAENGADTSSGADIGLGLGLFRREELNWSLLGWQWVPEDEINSITLSSQIQIHEELTARLMERKNKALI